MSGSSYIPRAPSTDTHSSGDVSALRREVATLRNATASTIAVVEEKTSEPVTNTLVMRDATGSATIHNAVLSGTPKIPTGANAGRVLTSDAEGNGAWQAIPTPDLSSYATNDSGPPMTNKTLTAPIMTGLTRMAELSCDGSTITSLGVGSFRMATNSASGRVLTTDSDGYGTWQAIPSVSGSSTATANTLVQRDSSAAASFSTVSVSNAPTVAGHATNKSYVDSQITSISTNATSLATANTLVKRDGSASASFSMVSVSNAPTLAGHATNKSYVDTQIAGISGAKYKGDWDWSTTYQTGNLVTQPVQIATVNKLYGDLVTPQTITNVGTIYNGVGVEFEGYGVVTGIQFYVPVGVRPDSGYTVYFHSAPGFVQSKLLPKASIIDGWNVVNFDSSISVSTKQLCIASYRTDASTYAWSNNTTPFGSITSNKITPKITTTSRFPDGYSSLLNTKVVGSDDVSFVSNKSHTSTEPIGGGRYVRISQPQFGTLNLVEIEVYQRGSATNIAFGKTVTMSTTLTGYPGSNLTNGILTDFAHTQDGSAPWMMIDLGATYEIETITVYNREGDASGRIRGASLSVLNSSSATVWTSEVFRGKSGSTTNSPEVNDGFLYYIANGAWSYNVGPIFTSYTSSPSTSTLYEAKTTNNNKVPSSSPTQWQALLTATNANYVPEPIVPVDPLIPITSSFTPTLTGTGSGTAFSIHSTNATYTLLGKLCFLQYTISWGSRGTTGTSTQLRCSLPFPSSNAHGVQRWAMNFGSTSGVGITSTRIIAPEIPSNDSWIYFWRREISGGNASTYTLTEMSSAGTLSMSGWYLIA